MRTDMHPGRLRRLDIQGFDDVPTARLAPVAAWLRLAYGLCATLAFVGTAFASTTILWFLTAIAALASLLPFHPFDLIYNLGIRRWTGTGALPRRGAPARFACGIGTVWLLATIWAFASGATGIGYALGLSMAALGSLVATTDICIPSMLFRALFGPPKSRTV